jgi:ribosome biogenesis GTPase
LQRRSLFKRRAAGKTVRAQLIAANVDTLFIVSSCNMDFNAARIERYLALAHEAEVTAILVLTKADLATDKEVHLQEATRLRPGLLAEAVDARSSEEVKRLAPWCGHGQTVALLGSSGVGKSTLLNTLSGASVQSTGGIREGDERGKHTTTARSLFRLPSGAWLLDTPGMRELQLTDARTGIGEVFSDVEDLAAQCRFKDCLHESEPGCAIQGALASGRLDNERLRRYRKLLREDARNSETLADAHARARAFGRLARRGAQAKRDRNGF